MSAQRSDAPAWIYRDEGGARALLALALADRYAELLHAGFERCEAEGEPLTERQRAALLAAAMVVLREGYPAAQLAGETASPSLTGGVPPTPLTRGSHRGESPRGACR